MRFYQSILVVVLFTIVSAASANIIVNGSFENPPLINPAASYNSGATFGNWTVIKGDIELINGYWLDAQGIQSLDLNGINPGGVKQVVSTVANQWYKLRFAMAGNTYVAATTMDMEVYWNGNVVDTCHFNTAGYTWSNMGWTYFEYNVKAVSSSTELRFESISTAYSNAGPALDDVSLVAIPEPVTVSFLGLGIGALLFKRR
ncbi:MAG: hypothetical protein A2Y10_06725 [Planctomycetes bacterium GWF2_41_51]|nr:MAG: hypothetical protein A2Y10_06725 [Planctomycetes bacterium GWF2_41_51]HBG29010.1 hypothetical protein [Phycisphaerales bacterium]